MGVLNKLMFWKPDEPDMNAFRQPEPLGPAPAYGTLLRNDPYQRQDPLQSYPNNPLQQSDPFGGQPLQRDPYAVPVHDQYSDPSPAFSRPSGMQQLDLAQPSPQASVLKEIEILSAKVDALRASIESMNQRIISIENIARDSQKRW